MDEIKEIIAKILNFFDISNFDFDANEEDDILKINLHIENAGILIGQGGESLKDLELILRSLAQKKGIAKKLVLDINNYRRLKENGLKEFAKETAKRVMITKKPVQLPAMNAYERRIIHMELATHPNVITESIGEEPERYLVVKPYKP